ncbi:signal peptidase I [Candidatus Nomurabacteria bacterium RIFCSPLOWO2_01_FULL_41_21]|uniref:Signal peptidase I n=2 Tax=Candidatus Nomuraibacteriota TaxID=1752729 RepID=A0A1F6V3F8_9BACT|nr:MAG: signal peptidase I [Candidatus Nomurabacteria bacterium RIFCSPHIGHO2_01_FULL_40_20]OGI88846.1 MAG: signal peptidase I [Candidatus Nomurabacteria bacterium RIFCSPLOWO2_01_FULL_41_21]
MEKEKSSFWELVRFALIAIAVVLPVRFFIAQPFVVSGSSMVPTFENGDYLIVDEISYTLGTPKRGDVVIFRYPKDPSKFFIKRIIGLPDETVSIKGNIVTIVNKENPDGFELLEPFIKNTANNNTSVKLDDDEYFVMGDNRSGSSDSRVWGPVKKNLLVGRALLRLLPVNKIGVMPGQLE